MKDGAAIATNVYAEIIIINSSVKSCEYAGRCYNAWRILFS